MEAKTWQDTVMTEEQLKQALKKEGHDTKGLIIGRLAHQSLEAQAKISFPAGIEEVVEYIRLHPADPLSFPDKWQVKIKDWGIKK